MWAIKAVISSDPYYIGVRTVSDSIRGRCYIFFFDLCQISLVWKIWKSFNTAFSSALKHNTKELEEYFFLVYFLSYSWTTALPPDRWLNEMNLSIFSFPSYILNDSCFHRGREELTITIHILQCCSIFSSYSTHSNGSNNNSHSPFWVRLSDQDSNKSANFLLWLTSCLLWLARIWHLQNSAARWFANSLHTND